MTVRMICSSLMLRLLLLALPLLLAAGPGCAFVLGSAELQGTVSHPRWQAASFPIRFEFNDRPLALLPNLASDSTPEAAIMAAMRAWSLPPIELRLDGKSATADVGNDGINLITFADTPKNRDVVSNFWAWTTTWWIGRNQQWQIIEADTVMNPNDHFATDGAADKRDIQDLLTHEMGHALGLGHSAIAAATMYPFGAAGQTLARTLATDDLAGLRTLYDLPTADVGAIAGRVQVRADTPVFGAHVVATNSDGIARAGALTDQDGSFTIPFLPPGNYEVYAEPLDGPVMPANLPIGYYTDSQHPILTQFRTRFVGGNSTPAEVRVTAGETVVIDPLTIEAKAPGINPRFVGWSPDGSSFSNAHDVPVQIGAGNSAFLVVVGEGLSQATDSGFSVSGGDVTLDTSQVERGTTTMGFPYAILPLSARAGAPAGARNVYVASIDERAAFTGCLEILSP